MISYLIEHERTEETKVPVISLLSHIIVHSMLVHFVIFVPSCSIKFRNLSEAWFEEPWRISFRHPSIQKSEIHAFEQRLVKQSPALVVVGSVFYVANELFGNLSFSLAGWTTDDLQVRLLNFGGY